MELVVFAAIVLFALAVQVDVARTWTRTLRAPARADSVGGARLLARTLFAAPALWIVALAALVARAWIRVGERPVNRALPVDYFEPWRSLNVDPREFAVQHALTGGALLFVAPVLAIGIGAWVASAGWRRPDERTRAALAVVAAACVLALVTQDLGGFWSWASVRRAT